jgi:predicted lysophospholipase L1 biosynthesis ABC-type transport system permease subunit
MLDKHYHQRADNVSPLGAIALFGLFVTFIGPVLAIGVVLVAALGVLVAYLAVCDLGGWLMVVFATRSFPPNTWPLTGGLFKIIK